MYNNQNVITFGCRLNIYESEIIKKNLKSSGIKDVVVINTCAVTQEAEKQAKQTIRKIKKNNSNIKIIVTGCGAQVNSNTFAKMKEVDKIIGNDEKLYPEYYSLSNERVVVNDIMSIKETANHLITNFENKTRAFIQIQNGCNHRCTFCIIPFARGRSRSVTINTIIQQINTLLEQGYKEIVFTGVDLTAYGHDLENKTTLAKMIKEVLSVIPSLKRIRLSSIDVAEIDGDLFNLMVIEDKLMPHFHISLQSGDNTILKRMKRRHNRESVISFCKDLRNLRPDVAFGADIIVGFPTETDEMFENTKKLVVEANLQYLHVFPYSSREGTLAARMPQVEKSVTKNRSKILRQLGEEQLHKFMVNHIGLTSKVLVEKDFVGYSENYIKTTINQKVPQGNIVEVKFNDISNNSLVAQLN